MYPGRALLLPFDSCYIVVIACMLSGIVLPAI